MCASEAAGQEDPSGVGPERRRTLGPVYVENRGPVEAAVKTGPV